MDSMSYSKEIMKAEKHLEKQQFEDAAKICAHVLENVLKDVYGRTKVYAPAGFLKHLLDIEEKISGGMQPFQKFTLFELATLFREGEIIKNTKAALGREIKLITDSQLYGLVEAIHQCVETGNTPSSEELQYIFFNLKIFLKEFGVLAGSSCPRCGETVEENWKFCPSCETPLKPLACPLCGKPIQEKWKRCPNCGSRLVCPSCGSRTLQGHSACPVCKSGIASAAGPESDITDPVTGMAFSYVGEGTFMMGDNFGEGIESETPLHEVQLKGFYIGKYLVTQAQWQRVMESNPSRFQGDSRPVEQVSWYDVQLFVERLCEMSQGKFVYHLPSEAQWEYAARSGGKNEKYAGGDQVDAVAWYEENSDGATHPVGKKEPNGIGIYDMSGNVWEWCQDVFREDAYKNHTRNNPVIDEGGSDRVIRGGSWNLDSWSVRCARRFSCGPDFFGPGIGFRLVRVP